MNIVISNRDDRPIYEQITAQIKEMIISGKLKSGEALPSIRVLAKDLRISVITTKRDGFIETVAGKGSFVAEQNGEAIREEKLKDIERRLEEIKREAELCGIDGNTLREIFDIVCGEDEI